MLLILGETLASRKYSFYRGIKVELRDEEDLILDNDDESLIDHSLCTSATVSAANTRPSTLRPRTSDSAAAILDNREDLFKTQAQKRH